MHLRLGPDELPKNPRFDDFHSTGGAQHSHPKNVSNIALRMKMADTDLETLLKARIYTTTLGRIKASGTPGPVSVQGSLSMSRFRYKKCTPFAHDY